MKHPSSTPEEPSPHADVFVDDQPHQTGTVDEMTDEDGNLTSAAASESDGVRET